MVTRPSFVSGASKESWEVSGVKSDDASIHQDRRLYNNSSNSPTNRSK